METHRYDGVFWIILNKAIELLDKPEYVELMDILYISGAAKFLPNKVSTNNG